MLIELDNIAKGKTVSVNVNCNREQLLHYLLDIYNAVEANNLSDITLELFKLSDNTTYTIRFYMILES